MPKKKKMIGLALGSGAARGVAHIGVLKWLNDNSIKPDLITGTSIGAFMGGFFAAGFNISDIIKEAASTNLFKVLKYVKPTLNPGGFISLKGPERYIRQYLDGILIEDLPIKFAAVATEFETGDQVVFTSGKLSDAVMASIASVPIFPPYKIDDREYVDGALSDPVPVDAAKMLGAETVFAVDVSAGIKDKGRRKMKKTPKIVSAIVADSFNIFIEHLTKEKMSAAGECLLIKPDIPDQNFFAFENAADLIECGYNAMEERREEIMSYFRS